MKHLETKREAAERRRVALMSKGIATFLETNPQANGTSNESTSIRSTDVSRVTQQQMASLDRHETPTTSKTEAAPKSSAPAKEFVLDRIRMTLNHAAEILRESLELTAGGVVFLDTAVGYTENEHVEAYSDPETMQQANYEQKGRQQSNESLLRPKISNDSQHTRRHLSQRSIRSSDDKHKASKVLAMSTAETAAWDPQSRVLDGKTLQSLIKSYPKGNVWYIDDDGYFSSLEQVTELQQVASTSPSGRRRSISPVDVTKQNAEAALLSRVFDKARQIIFLPLWDAGGGKLSLSIRHQCLMSVIDRWYSGCFVWSQSAVPVFTVESEIAYLSAFTNSVMAEISRLDAITSNKMKSDFISSISRNKCIFFG